MGAAKINVLSHRSYAIRPALAEAKLLTDKHARDTVYVVTLSEELRNIEAIIAAMEQDLQLEPSTFAAENALSRPANIQSEANWIRTKSGELDLRLRRLEELTPAATHRSSTRGRAKPGIRRVARYPKAEPFLIGGQSV